MGRAEDGDTLFLHCLEQGGLSLRRSTVDFIGEDEVGEKRSFLENELAAFRGLLEHGIARDVAGQEVRGELDAFVLEFEGLGKCLDQFGLAETGEAFEENVASGEQSRDNELDEGFLPIDGFVEGVDE